MKRNDGVRCMFCCDLMKEMNMGIKGKTLVDIVPMAESLSHWLIIENGLYGIFSLHMYSDLIYEQIFCAFSICGSQALPLKICCRFNINPHCLCISTMLQICRNMEIFLCVFTAVATKGKYIQFYLINNPSLLVRRFTPVYFRNFTKVKIFTVGHNIWPSESWKMHGVININYV